MSDQKIAYVIIDTERTEDGQYIPCIVKEGETGYWKTDWAWGRDKAQAEEIAKQQNAKMGISNEEAMRLVLQSFPKKEDIHKELDKLRERDSEFVLEWIRQHVHPDLDLEANVNPADIRDWTLEWD